MKTQKELDKYSQVGLRTLITCKKDIDKKTYEEWSAKYKVARESIKDRKQNMERVQNEIETGCELLGATAIEDKLQD